MIDVLFEQHVIQNTGLAAEAIWYAVNEAYSAQGRTAGVPLVLSFLVLPLTFHQRTANALASKTQPGALYKALSEDREITVGLQPRMQAMSDRTSVFTGQNRWLEAHYCVGEANCFGPSGGDKELGSSSKTLACGFCMRSTSMTKESLPCC